MSFPNHIFATAGTPETLPQALDTKKETQNPPLSHPLSLDILPSHSQEQNISIPNTHLTQTTSNFQQLYQDSFISGIETHTIDNTIASEGYLCPITAQSETDLLDPWIPTFPPEPPNSQTSAINQDQLILQTLWPWEITSCEGPDTFDTYDPTQYPETELADSQEGTKRTFDEYQASLDLKVVHSDSTASVTTIQYHIETRGADDIAKGPRIDEVLRTLRQMDTQIRAMNSKHMADITCSSTV